jgi:hypothetical protein
VEHDLIIFVIVHEHDILLIGIDNGYNTSRLVMQKLVEFHLRVGTVGHLHELHNSQIFSCGQYDITCPYNGLKKRYCMPINLKNICVDRDYADIDLLNGEGSRD